MGDNLLQQSIDPNTGEFLQEAAASKFDFHSVSVQAAGDERLKTAINNAVLRQYTGRQLRLLDLPDSDALRTLAGEIKQHTLDNLDYYLEQLIGNVERNGGHVHFAADGPHARQIILDLAAKSHCSRCIKSKTMVSEEINLAHALELAGMDVVETDLGEFIVQISHDKPSHLVAPIVHKDRASIAKLFSEYFHTPYNDDPQSLTMQARVYLRDKFRTSDFGMTGGNFLVAETGQVCCVENEGNQRQSITTPRVLVSLVGIEKVVPRLADLSVMLKLLARSATGQPITIYTNIFGGPRLAEEKDGPEEFHLVLIDNGRTEILASEEYRETLRCIRCGACLNACPIYRKIGGHAYGSVYPGPIGALITPLFQGLGNFKDLPQASSLCGACYEACPVKINIPRHLINLRRDINKQRLNSPIERIIYRLWAWSMRSPLLYATIGTLQKWDLRRRQEDRLDRRDALDRRRMDAGTRHARPGGEDVPSALEGAAMIRWIAIVAVTTLLAGCHSQPKREASAVVIPPLTPHVSVMTYNVNFGMSADPATVQAVAQEDADVIFLQETTEAWEQSLRVNYASRFPYMEFKQHPPCGGLAVLSKLPIESIDYLPPKSWFPAARVVLQTPVGRIQVLNVHLRPPASDSGSFVSGYFTTPPVREREISTFVTALDPDLPTLIVGDFNEGERGRAARWLTAHGYRSALPEFQPGAKTWRWATSIGTLRGDYDHLCYNDRLRPLHAEVRDMGQSDHLPVVGIFTLAVPASPTIPTTRRSAQQ